MDKQNIPKLKKYDLSILRLIDTITNMTVEERSLLLKEVDNYTKKIKLRATRKRCNLDIKFVNPRGTHAAIVKNISFTGAFVDCRVPVLIDEEIFMHFQQEEKAEGFKLPARIMHAKPWGLGVKFNNLDSRAARFIQTCMIN